MLLKKNNLSSLIRKAFTLAEIALVFLVISIVVTVSIKLTKIKTTYYLNKYMYYSAFNGLTQAVATIKAAGTFPTVGNNASPPGLCQATSDIMNTVGTVDCTQTANDSTTFKTATPNFITTNGMRFFNFGTASSGTPAYFTVYVDIDGSTRNAALDTDVMKFRIYTSGDLLPEPSLKGATNTGYMTASVRYLDASSNYVYISSLAGVNYITATCKAGIAQTIDSGYCGAITQDATCTTNTCEVVPDKPRYSILQK